jgi:hypothetical protein
MEFVYPCSAFESRVLSLLIFSLIFPHLQKALRAQNTEMPEPTQWDNDLASGKACELTEHMDMAPYSESENSESD